MIASLQARLTRNHVACAALALSSTSAGLGAALSALAPGTRGFALPALGATAFLALMSWALWRGWRHAGPLASLALAAMIGWLLPEPFVSTHVPAIVVLPMLVALLVAPSVWSVGAGALTMIILLTRAGFTGIYTQPVTIIVMGTINATVVLSQLLVEQLLREARALNGTLESRVAERTAALAAQTARTCRLLEAKTELYSTVAHDLRHDLTLITGMAHLLVIAAREGDTAEADHFETRLMRVIRRQASYATDVYDVSMLAEGQPLPLRPSIVSLDTIAIALADELVPEAEPFGICFVIERSPEVPPVWSDPQRTERVLRNLFGNAIKAVRAGGNGGTVTVRFSVDGGLVQCEVTDTGIGIAPEDLQRIGHRFVRAGLPKANGDGTGLGLTLSAQLVTLMGGTLIIDSLGIGLGAVAKFTLPSYDGQEG